MKTRNAIEKHLLLFLPWAVSLLFQSIPTVSYFIAWLGSFFIFFVSLTGKIKPLPADRRVSEQLMRPIFIVQIIFAGYMSSTSIFYFLSLLGYEYLSKTNSILAIDENAVALAAQCQRYYCLGHAAFVSGILLFMKYPVKQRYYIPSAPWAIPVLFSTQLAQLYSGYTCTGFCPAPSKGHQYSDLPRIVLV
jgi:magnesium-transporting ATPase (P-type)